MGLEDGNMRDFDGFCGIYSLMIEVGELFFGFGLGADGGVGVTGR